MIWKTDVLPIESRLEEGHFKPVGPDVDPGLVNVPVENVVVDDGVSNAKTPGVLLVGIGGPFGLQPSPELPVNVLYAVLHVALDDLVRSVWKLERNNMICWNVEYSRLLIKKTKAKQIQAEKKLKQILEKTQGGYGIPVQKF